MQYGSLNFYAGNLFKSYYVVWKLEIYYDEKIYFYVVWKLLNFILNFIITMQYGNLKFYYDEKFYFYVVWKLEILL